MKEFAHALYLPIIALALPAAWLLLGRIITFRTYSKPGTAPYLFKVSLAFLLSGIACEQVLYWTIRTVPGMRWLDTYYPIVAGAKSLYLAGVIVLCAALSLAMTNRPRWALLTGTAVVLWTLSFWMQL